MNKFFNKKGNIALIVLGTIALIVLSVLFTTFFTMICWNEVFPSMFGFKTIDFRQSFFLVFLASLLVNLKTSVNFKK